MHNLAVKTQSDSGVILAYKGLITSKKISADKAQQKIVNELANLQTKINQHFLVKKSLFSKLFKNNNINIRGLYIYGGVGRGKSMLMDLFFDNLDNNIPATRTHFYSFMSEVHTKIKEWHDKNEAEKSPDVIKYIASEITKSTKVFCFDEMQINDIADAMIIGRLFEALIENGVVIIATSNRHPDELYKDGLQRDRFLPFIEMFKRKMKIVKLESATDYRMQHIGNLSQTYITPLSLDASAFLEKAYQELSGGGKSNPKTLMVRGRKITALKSHGDVAFFSFKSLCDDNLGSEDYIEIAKQFGTIIISNIPKMKKEDYNIAIRFTKLIDELYEYKTKLICSAEVEPSKLYIEGYQSFEFERTISRLIEMQSKEYLELEHRS
jgi:cell division protein ZapE